MKLAGAIVIAMLAASPAFAETARDRAKEHYDRGEAAFKLGRFEAALQEYAAAYELDAHPDLLFNIAQCHRNMQSWDRSIFFLERYLDEAEDVEDREQIEALIVELEEKRARRRSLESIVETRIVTTTVASTSTVTLPVYVDTPPYEKAWFWGLIAGAVAVVGGAVALAVVSQRDGVPSGDYEFDLR
jgi:tetratricopeptide (TPR) repeat protein